jgi:hypothetical protein
VSRYLKPGFSFELHEGVEVQAKRSTKLGRWENAIVMEAVAGELPILRFHDGALLAVRPTRIRSRHMMHAKPALRSKAGPLKPLGEREYSAAPVPSKAEIRGALEQGSRMLRAAASRGRPFTPGGAPRPKTARPHRSPAYLAFVREHACCACGAEGPSDAHHFGPRGLGEKTDDFRTAPLCRRCHDEWHARGFIYAAIGQYGPVLSVNKGSDTSAERGRQDELRRMYTERLFYRTQVDLLLSWRETA